MGRPYEEEMGLLEGTYEWARRLPAAGLDAFLEGCAGRPLCAVGSGGSFTAAVLAAVLHRRTGALAAPMTPLEYAHGGAAGPNSDVLLVSAGGNNADILSAFSEAARRGARSIGVLCASDGGGRLAQLASGAPGASVHAAAPPSGKDGFLATNTLLATMVWIARPYCRMLGRWHDLPPFAALDAPEADPAALAGAGTPLLILHDEWGRAAAADAESKLSESGLACAQVADYRNFAHGRHNGLARGSPHAGIVALVSPLGRRLAEATLGLVPRSIPSVVLETRLDGPAGALALAVSVMRLVGRMGALAGTDPGRPKVAGFGRQLYSLPDAKRSILDLPA